MSKPGKWRKIFFLLIPFITAGASVLHGGDTLSKGVVIALHFAASALVMWAVGVPLEWLFVAALPVGMWWVTARGSAQARSKLDSLANPTKQNLRRCWEAYVKPIAVMVALSFLLTLLGAGFTWNLLWLALLPPTVFLPAVFLKFNNYETKLGKKLLAKDPHGGLNHRLNELLTGLTTDGLNVMALAWGLAEIIIRTTSCSAGVV